MTFRDVIKLWGSADRMAAELGHGQFMVRNWFARNNIPPEYWPAIARRKRARAAGVTEKKLANMAVRRKAAARSTGAGDVAAGASAS